MTRKRNLLACAIAILGLVLPASMAGAARPVKGSFLNPSSANGVRLDTTRHTITSISFYCHGTRWDLVQFVHVRKNGKFSYRGKLTQYGPEGMPWGYHRGRISGRFTSAKRVRIKRKLPGVCGTAVVRATGKRS
jgi:hypothetical protein